MWTRQNVWNNDGDSAVLLDSAGEEVHRRSATLQTQVEHARDRGEAAARVATMEQEQELRLEADGDEREDEAHVRSYILDRIEGEVGEVDARSPVARVRMAGHASKRVDRSPKAAIDAQGEEEPAATCAIM